MWSNICRSLLRKQFQLEACWFSGVKLSEEMIPKNLMKIPKILILLDGINQCYIQDQQIVGR